jgi:hypothetical protein
VIPSVTPSEHPSELPTEFPTEFPSEFPTLSPSDMPISTMPSSAPTNKPTISPSSLPSESSRSPSLLPSASPSLTPIARITLPPSIQIIPAPASESPTIADDVAVLQFNVSYSINVASSMDLTLPSAAPAIESSIVNVTAMEMKIDSRFIDIFNLQVTRLPLKTLRSSKLHMNTLSNAYSISAETVVTYPTTKSEMTSKYESLTDALYTSQETGEFKSDLSAYFKLVNIAANVTNVEVTASTLPEAQSVSSNKPMSSPFPGWAIAVIVIGVLLLAAAVVVGVAKKWINFGSNKVGTDSMPIDKKMNMTSVYPEN